MKPKKELVLQEDLQTARESFEQWCPCGRRAYLASRDDLSWRHPKFLRRLRHG